MTLNLLETELDPPFALFGDFIWKFNDLMNKNKRNVQLGWHPVVHKLHVHVF